jgi:hypothetical protein
VNLNDLKSPFEDDSHTFHDGPLQRYFRMRKWFFLTGLFIILLDRGWIDYSKISAWLGVGSLPASIVSYSLMGTGVYLIVQSVLVLVQISTTYRASLAARVETVRSATVDGYMRVIENMTKQLEEMASGELVQKMLSLGAIIAEPIEGRKTHSILSTRNQLVRALLDQTLEVSRNVPAEMHEHAGIIKAARSRLLQAARSHNRSRTVIATSEMSLDAIRILPTFTFLVFAVTSALL